jgi:hypothetical protein
MVVGQFESKLTHYPQNAQKITHPTSHESGLPIEIIAQLGHYLSPMSQEKSPHGAERHLNGMGEVDDE